MQHERSLQVDLYDEHLIDSLEHNEEMAYHL